MAVNWTAKPVLTDEMDEGFRVATIDGIKLKWSGTLDVPDLGEQIHVTFNGFGRGFVRGYCYMDGFAALLVEPEKLPDWYVKQSKTTHYKPEMPMKIITVFGIEFKTVDDPFRCRYDDCSKGYPVATDDEHVTCPACRKDMGLPPLTA